MNTLELTLQRKTDSGYPVIAALTRPSGFLPLRREGMLNLDIPALSDLQYAPLAYGTALGQALFVDDIRDTFREGLSGGEPLRVLLSIEAPDLRVLDWHRLAAPFDGRWRCLASQQNTPFSLSIPSPASAHFPAIGRRDLRALLLVAGPESLSSNLTLASFDVAATTASIQAALGDIPCDVLANPSLDVLCAALTQTSYTILHLVCHGAINQNGETILYFPKDENKRPTPASDLLNRLGSLTRLPHFAFISACESALPHNGLGSLAGRLVRELGLPAVLAMTDRVSIATASAIAAPFYAHLYQHGQPDLALAQSLAGLQGAHDLTVPAIFSRLGDRPLFDDNSERALTDKELEFGLAKLAESLPERAPVMDSLRDSLTRRLRSTLGADVSSLSESRRTERKETLDGLNSLSLEALDLSFNALCLGQTPPAYDSCSPFRGLESFRPEDAAYFFGREALTKRLVQKLNEHNFLAVLGASGSGKSSLVMAGLIPALNVPYAIFRPGAEPLSELEKALQTGSQLLVVDQFEELFTLSAREQRADFISRLLEQSQRIRVVITLRADFLGEVAPFKSLKDEVENHQVIIPPMDEAELRRAMEGQASCAGLRFESDLSQQMLDDVAGEPGAMPLLQHALWTLWTRRHGRWLRAEEYRAFGGVKQAIASTAEAVFARCNEFEKERLRDIFLRLTRLDDSSDGRDTRRRVLLRDLIPADSDPAATTLLIKQLADARLVVVTGDEVEVAHEALIRHWERLRAWLNDDRDNLRLREGVSDDARRWDNAHRDESLLNHRGPRLELALAMSKTSRYRLNPVEQAYLDGCVELREREKAIAARRRRYAITGVSVAVVIIVIILIGWGWTSNENSKQLSDQVATATYAQGFAQLQAATAEAAKATAIGESNVRATAQVITEEQRNIALARQLAAQSKNIEMAQSRTSNLAGLLAVEAALRYSSLESDQALRYVINNLMVSPYHVAFRYQYVENIKFSPSGNLVVAGSGDGVIKVWEFNSGKILVSLKHPESFPGINDLNFNLNENLLVSCHNDGTIRIWSISENQEIIKLEHGGKIIWTCNFSQDGTKIISGGDDGFVRIWDLISGEQLYQFQHDAVVTNAQFSRDGQMIISSDQDGKVYVWDKFSGVKLYEKNHFRYASVVLSPIRDWVASGGNDGTVSVWELATGNEIIHINYGNRINDIAFSPDGNYLLAGSENYAQIWNIKRKQLVVNLVQKEDISYLGFSSDGKYVLSIGENLAILWDTATGEKVGQLSHDGRINDFDFSPDGKAIVTSGSDYTARIWNISDVGSVIQLFQSDAVYDLVFSQDGKYLLSGSRDSSVVLWNTANGEMLLEFFGRNAIREMELKDDILVVGDLGGMVQVWDIETKEKILSKAHNGRVASIAISPNGNLVVSAGMDDAVVSVWNIKTGEVLSQYHHKNLAYYAIFDRTGNLVISSDWSGKIVVTDAISGNVVLSLNHGNMVYDLDIDISNQFLASGGCDVKDYQANCIQGSTRIWSLESGKQEFEILHAGRVDDIAFSPNGRLIASASADGTVQIYSIDTKKVLAILEHGIGVRSVNFNFDGTLIVTGSDDGTARVWNIAQQKELARQTHTGVVYDALFSPDNSWVASASGNGEILLWEWNSYDLLDHVCRRLQRNLSQNEWATYIGSEPYRATCPNLPIEPEPTPTP